MEVLAELLGLVLLSVAAVPSLGADGTYRCLEGHTTNSYVLKTGFFIDNYILQSPNFGERPYSNNTVCRFTFLNLVATKLLSLTFNAFDVQPTVGCTSDSLCVNGVKFCGTWLKGRNFYYEIPPNSSFTLTFASDSSDSRNGFEVQLVFADFFYSGNHYTEVSGGDGSDESTVTYSLPPSDDDYQDICLTTN